MLIPIKSEIPAEQATPEHLGGKGYGLHWMHAQGVNVPPALVIPTTVCVEYMQDPKGTMKKVGAEIGKIIKYFTDQFGYMPLLSVRSGARVSMPGMMDTILNVGLDSKTYPVWAEKLGPSCAANCSARLAVMYGSVVLGVDKDEAYKTDVLKIDASQQLYGAIEAVFKSWNNDRAIFYRAKYNIPDSWGTAVVVQAMVFGNLNDKSGTGVLFTRNPDTGAKTVTGEFLVNAQGEDVVDGSHTPMKLEDIPAQFTEAHHELMKSVLKLEQARSDVQDVEFTIQDGVLYLLQTRNAKRSARAAVRIAMDMANEGMITVQAAIDRVGAKLLDQAAGSMIDPKFKSKETFTGIPACSGAVSAKFVFESQAAIDCKEPCILVTMETTPDDIAGMSAAVGIITMAGGATSHAAVVARAMNKPCIVGLAEGGSAVDCMVIFKSQGFGGMDGGTGRVWVGEKVAVVDGKDAPEISAFRQFVAKHMGIIPISQEPMVGVDEYMLDCGGLVSVPQEVLAKVKACVGGCKKLYVDIRVAGRTQAEQSFNGMFGVPASTANEKGCLDVLFHGLPEEVRAGLVILTDVEDAFDFKVLRSGKSIESLILADGELGVDEGQTLDLSSKAVQKVMEWKSKEGLQMVAIGQKLPGAKSLLSVEKAMQMVQG